MKKKVNHFKDIPSLETKRTILEPLSKNFLSQDYVNWMNDKKVNRFLDSGGDYNIKKLEKYLTEVEDNPKYFWAIVLKENKKHIGNIKIDPINFKHFFGEYGIMIGDTNSWRNRYAEEVSKEVLNFCFKILKLRKINLGVLKLNKAAIDLYKKLGFLIEGHHRSHFSFEDDFVDCYRMALFNPNLK
tara:strand:+ start:1515 stop:2072 length:558 start_codon:yes stop_codon:yes gene_type:complete